MRESATAGQLWPGPIDSSAGSSPVSSGPFLLKRQGQDAPLEDQKITTRPGDFDFQNPSLPEIAPNSHFGLASLVPNTIRCVSAGSYGECSLVFYRLGVCYEHLRVYSHYVFGVVCTRMGVFCVLVFVYRDTVLFFGRWGCPVKGGTRMV